MIGKDTEWIKNLKQGDKVIVSNYSGWGPSIYYEEVVERITPKGMIRVAGYLYREDGNRRGGGACLENPKDEEVKEILEDQRKRIFSLKVLKTMRSMNEITYETAKKIGEILGVEE